MDPISVQEVDVFTSVSYGKLEALDADSEVTQNGTGSFEKADEKPKPTATGEMPNALVDQPQQLDELP
jgi:hypothetical protein